MRTVRLVWAAFVAAALLLGCAQIDSVGVATSEIHPQVRVVSDATATEVSVVLFRGAGGFTRLQLDAGDALTVGPLGGAAVPMAVVGVDTVSVRYEATLPAVASGDQLVLALARASDVGAPDTRITIPPAPEVMAPAAGTEFRPDQPFAVAWTPFADDAVELRFALGWCDGLTVEEAEAVAALVALPGPLEDGLAGTAEATFFPGGSTLSCAADLLVGRVAEDVDLDAAFGGLRAGSRIVREAPPRALTFVP